MLIDRDNRHLKVKLLAALGRSLADRGMEEPTRTFHEDLVDRILAGKRRYAGVEKDTAAVEDFVSLSRMLFVVEVEEDTAAGSFANPRMMVGVAIVGREEEGTAAAGDLAYLNTPMYSVIEVGIVDAVDGLALDTDYMVTPMAETNKLSSVEHRLVY